MSDAEYESLTLQHWIGRLAEVDETVDEISITVRSGGEMARFVLLRPNLPVAVLSPSQLVESAGSD